MPTFCELLKDEFQQRQKLNPQFSLRSFALWLGVSPAQLSQLMSGKRPLTAKTAEKLGNRLGYSPKQKSQFFTSAMPQWLEADGQNKAQLLSEDKFRLISDWYHFAILSLTHTPNAKPEPRWVAARLGITLQQASDAIERLLRLDLIEIKPKFRQKGDPIAVTSDVPSQAIRKFHSQNLSLAMQKIETVEMENREFQSITFSANPKKIKQTKKIIDQFLTEMTRVLETGPQEEVFTLGVQLFPVTHVTKKGPTK